mgnify:FL=1
MIFYRHYGHYGLTEIVMTKLAFLTLEDFHEKNKELMEELKRDKKLNEDCLARHGYTLGVKRAEESFEFKYIAGTGFSTLGLMVGLLGKSIQDTILGSFMIKLCIIFAIIGAIMYYFSYRDTTARKRYYKHEKEYKEYDERFR